MKFYLLVFGLMILALTLSYGFGFAVDAFIDARKAAKRARQLRELTAAMERDRELVLQSLALDCAAKWEERRMVQQIGRR